MSPDVRTLDEGSFVQKRLGRWPRQVDERAAGAPAHSGVHSSHWGPGRQDVPELGRSPVRTDQTGVKN